nr:phosphodiester glycosidase family protein [Longimicrobium terrae]
MAGAWTVDSAGAGVAVAFNAGQFTGGTPWGWTVVDGREVRAPGRGPLSMALVTDRAGSVRFVPPDSIAAVRRAGGVVNAIQSYPALLAGDGQVPAALRPGAREIDLAHRDGRLAIGELRDGRILVALTRFDGLGGAASTAPLGFTVPEMAGLMGGLGCRRAMLLDGGISGQLLVRPLRGSVVRHTAWRRVPLGIVVEPR